MNATKLKQQEATQQVESILDASRPKNLVQGVTSGVGNILMGAVGSVGCAVLLPTTGLIAGLKGGGLIGGVLGVTGGAVAGALGAVALVVGGVIQGVSQIVRGIIAVPSSISGPMSGKWWNEVEGRWVLTDLVHEAKLLSKVPPDDGDILGAAINEIEAKMKIKSPEASVKETFYYDVLQVDPKADSSVIKRQYYLLARQYHPDKCDKLDPEGEDKFKDISEAYQVLSDANLRAKYDEEGREGLSVTRTSIVDVPKIDPSVLFAFLFGSDKFNDYVGRLSLATSAMVGDSQKISMKDARTLQRRRCTRLAILLSQRLEVYISGKTDEATEIWTREASTLIEASYGYELIQLIGRTYSAVAAQFLGSFDSGVGMPSISEWAQGQLAQIKKKHEQTKSKFTAIQAGVQMLQINEKSKEALAGADTSEAKRIVESDLERDNLKVLLQIMWTVTAVDITSTLFETCQMLFFDKSVLDRNVRKTRALAVKKLGEIFTNIPEPEYQDEDVTARQIYEEAAFAAMLETIKRKEEEAERTRK